MKIAVVRVRGRRSLKPKIKKTLELLRLNRTNHCVLIEDSAQNKGMISLLKDYVTFGTVSEEVVVRLLTKRGKKGSKRLSELMDEKQIKETAKKIMEGAKLKDFVDPVFVLRPPSKGYKDIKRHYPEGDLGARPDISPLLKRML
ncbi:uL30 family ribosomal protein [Candidatus Micrarchaeota archaeon]|nr:uL30 family ribosomal protein [Candidatus Micrarchaeota archaeon]